MADSKRGTGGALLHPFICAIFLASVALGGGPAGALADNGKTVGAVENTPAITIENIQEAYPPQQRDGYTYIKMGHVAPGGSGITDVETMKLSLARRNDPANDPVVVTNYTYVGDSAHYGTTFRNSESQKDFLQKALPILAKQSKRPLVYIEAIAMTLDTNSGTVKSVHFGSLLGSGPINFCSIIFVENGAPAC